MRKFFCAKMRLNLQKFLHFFKFYRNILKYLEIFFNKSSRNLAFTLVELMISLIVISLIAAAFVPVISKKLTTGSIFAGGSGSGGGFSKTCSEIDEDCDLCAGSICLSCKKTCSAGETLNTTSCSCETKIPYYMAVDGLYVTRFNMGDSSKTKIPAEAGVTVVAVGKTCGSSSDDSSKCCWQGQTVGDRCDDANGDYSGCNRTVCTWAAANTICANYKQDGRSWRLPTTSEMTKWGKNSKAKGNNGLMLCDTNPNYSSSYCGKPALFDLNNFTCSTNGCYPFNVWSGNAYNSSSKVHYNYGLSTGNWATDSVNDTAALSVRCVSEIVSNCETFASDGETCTACTSGYYLSGKECKKSTEVENCETYSKTENKCETCKDGYNLNGNKCEKSPFYMAVDNLYVTKYNMGDNTDTTIPTSAGVTVVATGKTCGSDSNYSTKCCWKGGTSGTKCDSANGSYSGCNRTVCNWAAANAICANYKQGGKTWRLPTSSELLNWSTYSKTKGNNGLMLCDNYSDYLSAYCNSFNSCPGSNFGDCHPYYVWSGTIQNSTRAYSYYLRKGSWDSPNYIFRTSAFSVRCVTEIVPNCKTVSGNTCTACKDGYYLSNNQCKARTTVANCATYSTTADKCESCSSGYKLSNNKCVSDFCSGQYFMKIGSLCVTKYNMGDSTETAIPSAAGVTIASNGDTCGSSSNYSAKCCWKGETSGSDCDMIAGNYYSGCNRTVCNWAAANAICANYTKGGKTWRLPTTAEMTDWLTNSKGKGNNGLMLCDYSPGYSSAYCATSDSCPGSYGSHCYPNFVWSGSIRSSTSAYHDYLYSGSWSGPSYNYRTGAFSVRCLQDI